MLIAKTPQGGGKHEPDFASPGNHQPPEGSFMKKVQEITLETLLPLGLVAAVAGGAYWFADFVRGQRAEHERLDVRINLTERELSEIKGRQSAYNESIHKIEVDLALIQQALGIQRPPRGPAGKGE